MIAGIWIAIVFGVAEYRIGELFEFFGDNTATLGIELGMKKDVYGRPPCAFFWRWFITILFLSIYAASIVLWYFVWHYARHFVPPNPEAAPNHPLQPTGAAQSVSPTATPPEGGPDG